MAEQTTETTVVADATQQGAAGAEVQTTTEKQTEQAEGAQATTTQETAPKSESTTEKPSVSAQERINRMYARLQVERAARQKAEDAARTTKTIVRNDDEQTEAKPLTESDVRSILINQESEKRYYDSEARVIERHPEAINEDGTYNINDTFVKAYIDIGRENPGLLSLENGPELAEAMAEKRTGISYTKGRKDEAKRLQTVTTNAHTSTSTTAVPRKTGPASNLNDVQRKIATRMGLTEAEYLAQQGNNKIVQKNWGGGRKS